MHTVDDMNASLVKICLIVIPIAFLVLFSGTC